MFKFKFYNFEYELNITRNDDDFTSEMTPLGDPFNCDCYLIDVPDKIREFMSIDIKLNNPKTAFLPNGAYMNLKNKPRLCDGVLAIQFRNNEELHLNYPRLMFGSVIKCAAIPIID
jgi:hypothetical protein